MSNPNIVYLANDSPKPSTSKSATSAEPKTTSTTTSISLNQAQTFSSEIQIPQQFVVSAYSNAPGNLMTGCQNNSSGINAPVVPSTPGTVVDSSGYYNLAPNAVLPLNYASNYITSGYCQFHSNQWEYLPPPPGTEVLITPSIRPNIQMAQDQYSAPNKPSQASTHPTCLDTSDNSKKYNEEVDKFLNKIKLKDNVKSKNTAKKKHSCDCTELKHKKTKTSVKQVPIKKNKTTKTGKPKLAPVKTKPVSQNRKHIDKIKKQIDFIENEIQRRKAELSLKEQQIQNEINIIHQKQPMMITKNTNELNTPLDNESKILNQDDLETERTAIKPKRKPKIKSVVNIAKNFNLVNRNKYKIDKRDRIKGSLTNYKNLPYPSRVKSFPKSNKLNLSDNNNIENNISNNTQVKTERLENKTQENITISLNLQQELNSTNKEFTISQHESTDRNEKEIHVTIRISGTDNPPQIQSTKNEENEETDVDLSFLDEIDVDEIAECLNFADEQMETDAIASECNNSPNIKYENNTTNSCMVLAPDDFKKDNTETSLEMGNADLSSTYYREFKNEKVYEAVADYNHTKTIKKDDVYDEFMEIRNIVNDPGFLESSQKSSATNEQSNPKAEINSPWAINSLADTYDPVIIKSCTIETETYNNISEYNNGEIEEISEAHHANDVAEDLKDYSSESAVSLTSYSNSTEYDNFTNNNNTPESSDTLHEDIESDDIEQRTKNLLLSIFNNPKLQHTETETQHTPELDVLSSNKIDDKENVLNIDDEMAVDSPNTIVDDSNKNKNYDGTETSVFECNNNIIDLLRRNNSVKTNREVGDTIQTYNPENIIQCNINSDNNDLLTNKDDGIITGNSINNHQTKTQVVENSDTVNRYSITNEAIEDQNKKLSEITKDNFINSENTYCNIQEQNQISDDIVSGNITKIDCEDMCVDQEELKIIRDNRSLICKSNDDAKEDIQTKFPDNNVSKIETSETHIVDNNANSVDESDNDVLIITSKPNSVVDLTVDSESKETRKKLSFNEVSKLVEEAIITDESETSDDENFILPQIQPLKSPRDFALAVKLEQDLSFYFHSDLEITGIINRGTFSDIYRVTNKNFVEVAAAKVIRNTNYKHTGILTAEWMKRMQEGIPKDKYHILYLLHGLVINGMWCYVLEYYPVNLEQVLEERGKGFCIETLQKLARQLVSAVLLLRTQKIIHSDINPKHILLNGPSNNLKLGGFDESFQSVRNKCSPRIGTVHYRAPELILGYFVGHSMDVWATALVLYEMMTNGKLFPGNTNNEVLYQQLCRLGPVPGRMLASSEYRKEHYRGNHFFRDGKDPVYKCAPRILYKYYVDRDRMETCIYGAYNKHWGRLRTDHKKEDYATLAQFCKLLKQMLLMNPYSRIGIESAYAHGFIYEQPQGIFLNLTRPYSDKLGHP